MVKVPLQGAAGGRFGTPAASGAQSLPRLLELAAFKVPIWLRLAIQVVPFDLVPAGDTALELKNKPLDSELENVTPTLALTLTLALALTLALTLTRSSQTSPRTL